MKKRIIVLIVFLLAAVLATILYLRSGKSTQATSLVTADAAFGYIGKAVTATGTIQPVDTVSVGAQVSGVVSNVYVDFNSVVKQGQLLAKVDASVINEQGAQAKANLASVKSNFQFQQNNLERQKQLFGDSVISKAEYQLAVNQYNSSRAAVDNAVAQLRLVQKNLTYTNIYSPINGVVLDRNVSAGQTIASSFNAPTLFVIAKDLTKMQVRAAVDEADIGAVKQGQHVTFTVDAFPEDIFEGNVQDILLHPAVSSNVVTYTTLINVDNKGMKLKPGMTASINIYIEEDSNALLIPARALNFKPDSLLLKGYSIQKAERLPPGDRKNVKEKYGQNRDTTNRSAGEKTRAMRSYVWIKSGDTLTERKVITGINDDNYVKVIQGLKAGETVITNMVKAGTKSNASQKSPFIPQMQRRPATNTRNQ